MGITDLFKVNQFKEQISNLETENTELKRQNQVVLTAQQMKPVELEKLISEKEKKLAIIEEKISDSTGKVNVLNAKTEKLKKEIEELKSQLTDTEEKVEIESFGLYTPRYDFANSIAYKGKIESVRLEQKMMIKNDLSYDVVFPLTFNGSESKGRTIQKKNGKQLIRSFNGECEAAISKVTYSNFDKIQKRIQKSFEQLNKLNEGNGIELSPKYLDSKIDELHLAYEYAEKKQQEKDELREQREREREEKRAQQEIKEAQQKITKEIDHYKKALAEMTARLSTLDGAEKEAIQTSIAELKKNIDDSEKKKTDLDYRAENPTAGYVYIISNIGSFGKDVVKIGVTRRLDPLERISELSSASVPFKFDVHALIFSYDAYSLETELHNHFANQRINKVNNRKEYFRVPISEIKEALGKYNDLTVDFNELAEAPEYRQTLALETQK